MRFDVLTLFPDMIENVLNESIIGRAKSAGLLEFNCINIRDFAGNKHNTVDDYPYSGGGGMVMQAKPVYDAYMSIAQECETKPFLVYMSPQGKVFNQRIAKELLAKEHVVLLCGHYEGVDERVIEEIVDMEISIGDYVLTGGEIPAMAVIDTVCRMVPGVLSGENAYTNESHFNGLLEYPQYTRPVEFMGRKVPDILLSGHRANIDKWQREQSLKRTLEKRPDLLETAELSESDIKYLEKLGCNNTKKMKMTTEIKRAFERKQEKKRV